MRIQGSPGAIIRQASPQQLAGKQLIVQKGGGILQKGVQPQIVTLVKTSTGMTVATLPKGGNIVQSKSSGTVLQQQGKNTIVKIVPSNSANKVLTTVKTIPSNMIQMNKATGKFVLSKNASGQIPTLTNQQLLVVSSNAGIRTIQTVTNAQAVNVPQVKTTTVNVLPAATTTSVAGLQGMKIAGKPITISMPMGVVGAQKTVTISKNTVS